ncbi:acyl-CoA dehydrogenase [Rhodococcus rhodnii]|nr:acyl-CoA dehydrogenase [Rhodococcus rhodnii]TXG92543.1 acyl-CoA dehydrogenase [Rhodococcus rhodnii]
MTADERDLGDAVRTWAQRTVTPEVVREAVDAKSERRPLFWPSLAELGALGIATDERLGGAGLGLVEAAVVVEELGRSLVPGPTLPSIALAVVAGAAGDDDLAAAIAAGETTGGIALSPGTLRVTREDGHVLITGDSGLIVGGQCADVLLVAAVDGEDTVFVTVPRDGVEVTDLDSHDVVRRAARLTADGARAELVDLDAERIRDVVVVLAGAEAAGVAERALATAAEYAAVREQFGRVIGQFQGVKHTVARMLTRVEVARATVWDAARAIGAAPAGDREATFAAAVAGATALDAAARVTTDCIQVLGGIGYTWEHDAHLYLRRAQSLRLLTGSTAQWHRRVADLTRDGVRRELGVDLPPHADEIRARVRADLDAVVELDESGRTAALAERGFTAPHLPAPWGRGADAVEQLVVAEELRRADLTPHDMIIGNWVVPTLIAHGTGEQQQRFVPPSLRGDIVWCQLYSEPGAGSDLASLTTRAVKVDGGWSLTGQKVWTSMAREADWGICLARTDPAAPKHKGLSYFLIDMKNSEGLDIRPLREITGESLFNEVFFDEVFVPDGRLVGEPGAGWTLARTTLANERVSLSSGSSLGSGGEALLHLADGVDLDAHRSTVLGQVLCDAQAGALLGLRATLRTLAGSQPGAESSVAKLLGVEHMQQVWDVAMEWTGEDAMVATERRSPTMMSLSSQCMSIAGGTTNVQLNIIGERLLGLPRDPEPAR